MKSPRAALISQPDTSEELPAETTVRDEIRRSADDVRTQLEALHASAFAWALACCGRRREDAEDVLHDVYAGVLDGRVHFEGRSSFKTWLFGVIRGTARSRDRRDRVRRLLVATRAFRIDRPDTLPLPDDDVIAADRRARTQSALDQLSRKQRDVVLLVFYHDLSVEEAANVMRVSVGSARVHYQRGKRRLAALLLGERE